MELHTSCAGTITLMYRMAEPPMSTFSSSTVSTRKKQQQEQRQTAGEREKVTDNPFCARFELRDRARPSGRWLPACEPHSLGRGTCHLLGRSARQDPP